MKKTSQYGRTMLETISVLALVGVLGITGIYMYMRGVNSAKSDALIKEVLVRASQKKANDDLSGMGSKKKVFTPEYAKSKNNGTKEYETSGLYGYEFSVESYKNVPNFVTVSVSGISAAICRDLKSKVLVYNSDGSAHIKCVLTTDPSQNHLKNCSNNTKNIAQSDCSSEDSKLHFVVEFGKKTTSQSASSGGGSGSGTNPTPDPLPPSEEQENICPENSAKMGGGEATNVDGCKCYAGLKWAGNACCPNGTSGDGSGERLSDYPQCKCPIHLQEYNSVGQCKCPTGFDECGGECLPECSGPGLSGERDPDTCACKCDSGLSGADCQCPAGQVFSDGQCFRAWCDTSSGYGLSCFIRIKNKNITCGSYCADSSLDQYSCSGYCKNYCPEDSTWGEKSMSYGGLGCVDNDTGLYCNRQQNKNSGKWICSKDKTQSKPCCTSVDGKDESFAKCHLGTCNDGLCKEKFGSDSNWLIIAARTGGCSVKKDGKTAYCAPTHADLSKWGCELSVSEAFLNKKVGSFKNCSVGDIKNGTGNCANLWQEPVCIWGEWDSDLKRCVGIHEDGQEYSCNMGGECFVGRGDKRCGYGCDRNLSPSDCQGGLCHTAPAGTEYVYNSGTKLYGNLRRIDNGYLLYDHGSWGFDYACLFVNNKKSDGTVSTGKICGTECNENCTYCKVVEMDECRFENQHCLSGELISSGCSCETDVMGREWHNSGGYCCPKGHVYHAGKCSIISKQEGKCYYGSHQIDETNDYKAQDNGVECQCVAAGHCMGKNDYGTISCGPEFCSENSAG